MYLLVTLRLAWPATPHYGLQAWTADNGLPQNIIRDIRQTPDGYLWVATLDGLARFDGVRFSVFNRSNTPGIESNRFTSLYEDAQGDLWLGTEASGVTQYHHGTFTTYTTRQGLPDNVVTAVTGDEAGNVWVLSGASVAQWNRESARFVDITPKDVKISNPSRWQGGGFWGVERDRLHLFVKGHFFNYPLPPWIPGHSIRALARDQDGTIRLGYLGGKAIIVNGHPQRAPSEQSVIYRDRRGTSWTFGVGDYLTRYMNYSSAGRPDKIRFVSLREDREGNLWLSTEGRGIFRVTERFVTVYSKEEGLIARNVYPIYQDRGGAMWIGAWDEGLSRFQDGRFTSYTEKDGLAGNLLTALDEDREGRLWAATHGGLRVLVDGRFREPGGVAIPARAVIQAILQDRQGAMWFGTSAGLVRSQDGVSRLFTVKDGLASDNVRVIAEGHAGDLWIGGFGGLTLLRGGQFMHWTERDGLPSNAVRAIYEDAQGVVWIGTYDGGLGRFENGRFTRYTMREGLFNNGAFQILEDARGNLWMSSNRGIYRVSKRELNELAAGARKSVTSVSYGVSDGMRNEECNGGSWPAGVKARDGTLWFPTQDGVAVIDPQAVPANPQPPPVEIEAFLLDRAPTSFDRPLRLAHDKTNFEIQYTALSFVDSPQIRFKYKLEGLDTDWVDAGARRTAYYSHVPPGHYTFTVIARNRDGVWNNQGKSLQVTVLAPYYRTWWFEVLASVCAAALVWVAWRYRVSQLEREHAMQRAFSRQLIASQETERKRIAIELHDSLGQRLVVIKNLALFFLRAQGDAAADGRLGQIEDISSEASLAINETREISYNLRPFQLDRLGLTKAIAGMIRTASTASGIHFSPELDNIDDFFPEDLRINFYRIVQECLNNIVKHSHATEASIGIRRSAGGVVLSIRDNGLGFSPGDGKFESGRNGFGLTGMAERARLLGGAFAIESAPGRGTVVRAEFQLRRKAHA